MKKRIALFLWRIAVRLIKGIDGKPVGIPYQRDPNSPCEFYEPNKKAGQWSFKDCEGDGHMLCLKCYHYSPPEEIQD